MNHENVLQTTTDDPEAPRWPDKLARLINAKLNGNRGKPRPKTDRFGFVLLVVEYDDDEDPQERHYVTNLSPESALEEIHVWQDRREDYLREG